MRVRERLTAEEGFLGKGYTGVFSGASIFLYHDIEEVAWLYTCVKNIVCFAFKINCTILHYVLHVNKKVLNFYSLSVSHVHKYIPFALMPLPSFTPSPPLFPHSPSTPVFLPSSPSHISMSFLFCDLVKLSLGAQVTHWCLHHEGRWLPLPQQPLPVINPPWAGWGSVSISPIYECLLAQFSMCSAGNHSWMSSCLSWLRHTNKIAFHSPLLCPLALTFFTSLLLFPKLWRGWHRCPFCDWVLHSELFSASWPAVNGLNG